MHVPLSVLIDYHLKNSNNQNNGFHVLLH
jgi:hypothetical protein